MSHRAGLDVVTTAIHRFMRLESVVVSAICLNPLDPGLAIASMIREGDREEYLSGLAAGHRWSVGSGTPVSMVESHKCHWTTTRLRRCIQTLIVAAGERGSTP